MEAASRVYFPLPDLSRKIERDSARRVMYVQCINIFPKFGKHIICSWKNNFQNINMFIQLEVYISIQEFSLFGGEQSFSVYTKQ